MGYQPFGQFGQGDTPSNRFGELFVGTLWLAKEIRLNPGALVRSTNFVSGTSGFIFRADGTVELNELTKSRAWTPALTGATTNPNLGTTGTAVGTYVQIGKLVFARFVITFGGTGITAGSGQWYISFPVAAAGHMDDQMGGVRLSITGNVAWGALEWQDTTKGQLIGFQSTAAGSFLSAVGYTSTHAAGVVAGNIIHGQITYIAA